MTGTDCYVALHSHTRRKVFSLRDAMAETQQAPKTLAKEKISEKKHHCCQRAAAMAHVVNHIGWGGWCCRASGASAFLFYLLLMPVYVRTMCPLS